MVVSVYHRIAADVRAEADHLDREYITRWFMAFASNKPLSIDHPRTGPIHIGGFAFCGHMAERYDDFTRTIINDLLDTHLCICEDGLETVPDAKLDIAVSELSGLLFSVATRLSDRQGQLKRRLLKKQGLGWQSQFHHTVQSMSARLASKVDEIRAIRGTTPPMSVTNNVSIETNEGAVQVGTVASTQTHVRSDAADC